MTPQFIADNVLLIVISIVAAWMGLVFIIRSLMPADSCGSACTPPVRKHCAHGCSFDDHGRLL